MTYFFDFSAAYQGGETVKADPNAGLITRKSGLPPARNQM
jgi:hypothetical protein